MESVTLENFRCFREKQTVKLAPLTLLVGENSTGKTSFLALVHVLALLVSGKGWAAVPDFKRPPFDLGAFDDIVHDRVRGRRAECFSAEFAGPLPLEESHIDIRLEHTFVKREASTVIAKRRITVGDAWAEERFEEKDSYRVQVGTRDDRAVWDVPAGNPSATWLPAIPILGINLYEWLEAGGWYGDVTAVLADDEELELTDDEETSLHELASIAFASDRSAPFASAPIRARPRRTYDPGRIDTEPEGDYIPMYLADRARHNDAYWAALRSSLETFGRDAGLFDQLNVRLFGDSDSDPFQLQVRTVNGDDEGQLRNLIDVGYGVSQVLPLATELVRSEGARQFLLQQPEVHLHPSAQAALGSLFCQAAAQGRQLIVETHSDHLIDRIRMDVRDGKTGLKPEDVCILYFERNDLDVKIHEITYDRMGNLLNTPPGYRSFFMKEIERSLWPPD